MKSAAVGSPFPAPLTPAGGNAGRRARFHSDGKLVRHARCELLNKQDIFNSLLFMAPACEGDVGIAGP